MYDDVITITLKTWWVKLLIVLTTTLVVLGLVRGTCVTFVDSYEVGYMYNRLDGHTHRIRRTGYIFHAPIVIDVHTVDLRPIQTCITTNSRVLNCKLVQFNPQGLNLFLSWHGRDNYTQVELDPILKAYAYEDAGQVYPFLTILREIGPHASE